MDVHSPQVLEMLKQQRRFHQEQLRLIDIAIAAIAAERKTWRQAPVESSSKGGGQHRIQWTREIGRLLEGYTDFSILDLRNDLLEKRGITSARTIQGQNVINNTLNRFQKKGQSLQRGDPCNILPARHLQGQTVLRNAAANYRWNHANTERCNRIPGDEGKLPLANPKSQKPRSRNPAVHGLGKCRVADPQFHAHGR